MTDPCECLGTGYLVHQTYGAGDLPDGAVPVQRCDLCLTFDGDDDAAWAALVAFGGGTWGFGLTNHDDPSEAGDYWIIPAKCVCTLDEDACSAHPRQPCPCCDRPFEGGELCICCRDDHADNPDAWCATRLQGASA